MFSYNGKLLHLKKGHYLSNMATYIGLFDENDELFIDVSINTPYSAINTIVISNDLIDCDEKLAVSIIDYLTDGKICDISSGFVTLPKYYINLKRQLEMEYI